MLLGRCRFSRPPTRLWIEPRTWTPPSTAFGWSRLRRGSFQRHPGSSFRRSDCHYFAGKHISIPSLLLEATGRKQRAAMRPSQAGCVWRSVEPAGSDVSAPVRSCLPELTCWRAGGLPRIGHIAIGCDAIFVEEDGFWSSAGVTAGMDLALAMVEQDMGRATALEVARRLVLFLKRPGGQSQFSMPLQAQSAEGPLAKLMRSVVENPAEDWRVDRLAQNAGMSERSLFRLFREVTSASPAEWVEQVRTERARRLLEDEGKSIDRIALEAGFRSGERLRRVFTRRLGVPPSVYRDRFALHSGQT